MVSSDRRNHRRWSPARVSWCEWLGGTAALLALASLLLPWTQLSATHPVVAGVLSELPPGDVARSVWKETFFGGLAPLLVILAGVAVTVFGQVRRVRVAGLPQLWLVASVVAGCSTAMAWVFADWQFGPEQRAFLTASTVVLDAGPGRWLAAVAVLLSLVGAFCQLRKGTLRKRRGRSS